MTQALSVSSEVEVAVDPATAFRAFTEEMDLWWLRGPINFWSDGARRRDPVRARRRRAHHRGPRRPRRGRGARARTHHPMGTGGAGGVGELARRRADRGDVRRDRRRNTGEGRARRAGRRPRQGWHGLEPRRPEVVRRLVRQTRPRDHEQIDIARLSLGISYARPAAAARWLAQVFGFEPDGELPEGDDPLPETEYGHPWIEFRIGNAVLNVFKLEGERTGGAHTRAVGLRRRPRSALRPRQGQRRRDRRGDSSVPGLVGLRGRRPGRKPLDLLAQTEARPPCARGRAS